jgi:hypothetical protein
MVYMGVKYSLSQNESIWELGAKKNVWICDGICSRRLKKLQNELHNLCSLQITGLSTWEDEMDEGIQDA